MCLSEEAEEVASLRANLAVVECEVRIEGFFVLSLGLVYVIEALKERQHVLQAPGACPCASVGVEVRHRLCLWLVPWALSGLFVMTYF